MTPGTVFGTPKIYTTTGLGRRKNREMAGVDDLVVYMQTVVKYNTFYIHHQIVHTSHFSIFSRPQPGGGVYLWGPNITHFTHRQGMVEHRLSCQSPFSVSPCNCSMCIRRHVAMFSILPNGPIISLAARWELGNLLRAGSSGGRESWFWPGQSWS